MTTKEELSERAHEYMEDLRTSTREEAMQNLKIIREMKTVVKKHTKSPVQTKIEKMAGAVSPDFLKELQKEGLV